MPIIHGFTFFNEFELLELKLEELWDVVDAFVLVEAAQDYQGHEKSLHFLDAMERGMFAKYKEKLYNFVVSLPKGYDNWKRERYQREQILEQCDMIAAQNFDVSDYTLIFTDLDEIVRKDAVCEWTSGSQRPSGLNMGFYYYWLNCMAQDGGWGAGKILKRSHVYAPLTDIRYDGSLPEMPNAGWHFSFMGGRERVKHKIQSYAHAELAHFANDINVELSIATGKDLFNRPDHRFEFVPIDKTYPAYMLDNLDKFAHMIKEV